MVMENGDWRLENGDGDEEKVVEGLEGRNNGNICEAFC